MKSLEDLQKYRFRIRNYKEYSMVEQYLSTFGYPVRTAMSQTDLNLALSIDKVYMLLNDVLVSGDNLIDSGIHTLLQPSAKQTKRVPISFAKFRREFMGISKKSYSPVKPKSKFDNGCNHDPVEYVGFTDSFTYCSKCGMRL